jgi:ATP-binding cassette subfamily F protein 3
MVESGVIRSYLARFGFSGDEPLNKVASLSGGEKTKLSLALLLYHPANFLILDEPTNHLDIDSREALEKAILEYDGTCLIVSHDRYFLDHIANRVLHIENGLLYLYEGNYSYFKEKRMQMAPTAKKKEASSRSSYYEFREKSKRQARHQRELKTAGEKLKNLEMELEKVEQDLNLNIPKTDWEKLHQAANTKKQLEEEIIVLIDRIEELEGTEID